jgi:serine/threonine protein phosphatase PrpC
LVPGIQGPAVGYKHFFGVCDGHGQNGHHASGMIKEQLPELLKVALNYQSEISKELDDKEYEKALTEAFIK